MTGFRILAMLAAVAALSACSSSTPKSSGTYKVGAPYRIAGTWYHPKEQPDYNETGLASWYGPGFHGRHTANGEVYNQRDLTAAHPTLPMPVNVRVTNLQNGRSIVLRVNDRGPFHGARIIDVSERAAELLGFKGQGTTKVRVEYLGRADKNATMIAQGAPGRGSLNSPSSQRVASESSGVTRANDTPARVPSMAPVPNPPSGGMAPVTFSGIAMAPIPNPAEPAPGHMLAMPPDLAAGETASDYAMSKTPAPSTSARTGKMYVQVGSFSDYNYAMQLYNRVLGLGKASISPTQTGSARVYRVRLGPVETADEASRLTASLKAHGHEDAQLVME